jgi:hypothetical protein
LATITSSPFRQIINWWIYFVVSSDTIRELKENGEKDNIISARSAQELMEKAIREEDADILDQAPSMKVLYLIFSRIVNNYLENETSIQ